VTGIKNPLFEGKVTSSSVAEGAGAKSTKEKPPIHHSSGDGFIDPVQLRTVEKIGNGALALAGGC
jgi:hypothetical protein